MGYRHLSREDFDAVVTGELTHFAIWMEGELVSLISEYFVSKQKRLDFERLVLRRDGLTFQDKIEIVRAMLPLFKNRAAVEHLKALLNKVEQFKSSRNAFAHGVDVTPKKAPPLELHVGTVNRAGKEKTIVVTPESHEKQLDEANALFERLQACRQAMNN